MPKDVSYHKAAVRYNEELAIFAEDLADTLENEEVQRWCRSVSKQHKFHAGRHKRALDNLLDEDVDEDEPKTQTKSIQDEQAEFAKEQESPNAPQPDRKTGENPDAQRAEAGVGLPLDDGEDREDS